LTWEEIDVEHALKEMYAPTGFITYVSAAPFQQYLGAATVNQVSRALTMAATLVKLAEAAGAEPAPVSDAGADHPDGGMFEIPDEPDTEMTSNSTTLSLEIACPGEFGYGVGRDFANGLLRIDSGNLVDFSLQDFWSGAHLLVTFDACAVPGNVIEGQTVGYLFGGFYGILLDAEALGVERGDIVVKYVYARQNDYSLLIDVEGEGTYRLDTAVEGDKVEIDVVAANGVIQCHFSGYGSIFTGCVLQ
jgi:hypothetical protein